MANQLTLGVGINAAALQAAINNVVNRTYTIAGVQVNNRGIAQAQQALGRITGSASEFQKSMEAANARVIAFGASAGVIFVLKKAFDGLISS
ncbi:MAG: hypothetical protein FJ167_10995, partial [Gammaproteobacteria bacterium]|nr:hypothetical protein [Gammaproteobacteria bacterium]